jgi:hypothetical protein
MQSTLTRGIIMKNFKTKLPEFAFSVLCIFIAITIAQKRPAGSDKRSVDWVKFHTEYIVQNCISDVTSKNLIDIIAKDSARSCAYHSIMLLGRRGDGSAKEVLVKALKSSEIANQIAAGDALFMLGDNSGEKHLENIANNSDKMHALDAAGVLARNGSLLAFDYLMKLHEDSMTEYKIGAIGHLKELALANENIKNDKHQVTRKSQNSKIIKLLIDNSDKYDTQYQTAVYSHLWSLKLKDKTEFKREIRIKINKLQKGNPLVGKLEKLENDQD